MKTQSLLAVALLVSAAPFSISAQRDNRKMESDVTTILLNDKADKAGVEKTLKENAPKAPNDNGLPRFAVVGKDKQFYLGIGGQFLGEGSFTWGDNISASPLFTPSTLTPSTPGNGGVTQFAWQTSSIYMNFVAMPGSDNQIGLFFKANFMGNNNSFNCFHFYAKYRGLTVGYTNSIFTDAAAEPMTIDFEGPNGYPFITLFTAYWQQNFTKNISGAIGIDAPSTSLTTNVATKTVNQRIPSIPLYLQYAWNDGGSHVRLSGLIRPMQYRNLSEDANKSIVGGGVQLSGMTGIAGGLSANFNAAYGKGIGTYLQDDNGLGLDAVATGTSGKMEAVKTLGLTGGLSYTICPKVSTNLTYSHLANWLPEDAMISDSHYRYGDYVAANVIYNINKFVSAGIEYDYGHRKDFNGNGLHANRLQCQLAVTF